jgi:hypothetical protein
LIDKQKDTIDNHRNKSIYIGREKQTFSVSTCHTNTEAQAQGEQTQENEVVWVFVLIMIQWEHHCRKYIKEIFSGPKAILLLT